MNYQGAYGGYSGLSGTSTFPSYDYKGGGLLDDDPRGLRKKKGLAGQLGANSVRILVAVLLLVACGGWLHSHKHKSALHRSLGETVGKMNTVTQDRETLQRQLAERDSRLARSDRELQQLRTRVDRLTAELGSTHSKHTQTSGKLEQDLLNCQGDLAVAQNRATELQRVADQSLTQLQDMQRKLEEETHLRVQQDQQHTTTITAVRAELHTCQHQLQMSGVAQHGHHAQQHAQQEQPAPAGQQQQGEQQQAQQAQQAQPVQQQQPPAEQQQQQVQHVDAQQQQAQQAQHVDAQQAQHVEAQQHEQQAQQQHADAAGQVHHEQHEQQHANAHAQTNEQAHAHAHEEVHGQAHAEGHAQAHDQAQAQAHEQHAQPQQHTTMQQRLRDARLRRHHGKHHRLSQLEQALGHEHGDEAIEQHPERH